MGNVDDLKTLGGKNSPHSSAGHTRGTYFHTGTSVQYPILQFIDIAAGLLTSSREKAPTLVCLVEEMEKGNPTRKAKDRGRQGQGLPRYGSYDVW